MDHLQRQIEKLTRMLVPLGTRVEESLYDAVKAIRTRDPDLAQRVIDGDRQIDALEVELEEECLHTLALHQPVAYDLRFVVAVLKINNNLERIGDLAANIAEQAKRLASEPEVSPLPFNLARMCDVAARMLNGALDALVEVDPNKAREVRRLDDEVDDIHSAMYERVSEAIVDRPEQTDALLLLTTVSRHVERIADHAVNIAKDVIYMAEGEIVRHSRARRELADEESRGIDPDPPIRLASS
ncbi:MAG: phosphate signaling complex protein PhoU [Planctomycetota bacterium]